MKFAKITDYDDIVLPTDKIQALLEDWIIYLKRRDLRSRTIKGKIGSVELFLEMNKVIFHKKILHKLIPSADYIPGGEEPFTTSDIQRMLFSTTKPRTKAIIHFLASTGIRPAALVDPVLKIKHLIDMPYGCKAIKVYDNSKEGYWAFLTPEASTTVSFYLESRKRNKEQLSEESPLFANSEKEIHGKKNDHVSAHSVRQIMSNVIELAGIERVKTGNRYNKAPVYAFRKRFNTVLKINNSVNSNIAEKLMGHKRGLDGSYLKPTRDQCFEEFL
ncbi:MAG: site-specific integrase, partial [Thaumarchaeota archaeon]|nr:site-specific integrase [Nitrososphaerota archaeon]